MLTQDNANFSIFFAFLTDGLESGTPCVRILNVDPGLPFPGNTFGGVDVLDILIMQDGSITFMTNGNYVRNSAQNFLSSPTTGGTEAFFINESTWNFLQVNLTIDIDVVLHHLLFKNFDAVLNGNVVFNSVSSDTGIDYRTLPSGNPAVNYWMFLPVTGNGSLIDEITVKAKVATNMYPHPGLANVARVSGATIESMAQPGTANARVAQCTLEKAFLPIGPPMHPSLFPTNARISQMVIELMTPSSSVIPPSNAGGWQVKEA